MGKPRAEGGAVAVCVCVMVLFRIFRCCMYPGATLSLSLHPPTLTSHPSWLLYSLHSQTPLHNSPRMEHPLPHPTPFTHQLTAVHFSTAIALLTLRLIGKSHGTLSFLFLLTVSMVFDKFHCFFLKLSFVLVLHEAVICWSASSPRPTRVHSA